MRSSQVGQFLIQSVDERPGVEFCGGEGLEGSATQPSEPNLLLGPGISVHLLSLSSSRFCLFPSPPDSSPPCPLRPPCLAPVVQNLQEFLRRLGDLGSWTEDGDGAGLAEEVVVLGGDDSAGDDEDVFAA